MRRGGLRLPGRSRPPLPLAVGITPRHLGRAIDDLFGDAEPWTRRRQTLRGYAKALQLK